MNGHHDHSEEPPPPYSPFDFDNILEQRATHLEDPRRAASTTTVSSDRTWSHTPSTNECPGCQSIRRTVPAPSMPASDPMFKALFDFVGQAASELSLAQGEIVTVTRREPSGWWLVKRLVKPTEVGWVPESFLQASVAPSRAPPTPVSPGSAAQKHSSKGLRSRLMGKGHRHTSSEKSENASDLSPSLNNDLADLETNLCGILAWSALHNVTTHNGDISTLRVHNEIPGAKWSLFTSARLTNRHLLIKLTTFAYIRDGSTEGNFSRLPSCFHMAENQELRKAHFSLMEYYNTAYNPLGIYSHNSRKHSHDQLPIEGHVFRCPYCPSEYRLSICFKRLNADRRWVKADDPSFRVEQWVDVGEARLLDEHEWTNITTRLAHLTPSALKFDLHGATPVKARFEDGVNNTTEDDICSLQDYHAASAPLGTRLSTSSSGASHRGSGSVSSGARASTSSATPGMGSPGSGKSVSAMSPLQQSRAEKGGNLTFRPFHGFDYEAKAKGKGRRG